MNYDEYYYRENFRTNFLNALDYHYGSIPPKKRRGQFIHDYDYEYFNGEYGSVESSMKSWLSGKVLKVPGVEVLMRICNILDCDVDFFLTEQEDYKKKIRTAAEIIGLRYETIDAITNYNDSIKKIFNTLTRPYLYADKATRNKLRISTNVDYLFDLLLAIDFYTIYSPSTTVNIMDSITGLAERTGNADQTFKVIQSYSTLTFSSVLENLRSIIFDNDHYNTILTIIENEEQRLRNEGFSYEESRQKILSEIQKQEIEIKRGQSAE